jgi:hypothetical protein
MLSTTVEPECRQRPFVVSYAVTEPGGVEVASAEDAPVREASKALAQDTIHPAADRVATYGATVRANSPAVHRRGC